MSLRTALRFLLVVAILAMAFVGSALAQTAEMPMPRAKKRGEFSLGLQIGGPQVILVHYELKLYGTPVLAPMPREWVRIKACAEEEVFQVEGPGQLQITTPPAAPVSQAPSRPMHDYRDIQVEVRESAAGQFLLGVNPAYQGRCYRRRFARPALLEGRFTAAFGPVPLALPQGFDITGQSAIDPFSVRLFNVPPAPQRQPACNEMDYTWNYARPAIATQQAVPMPRTIVEVIGVDNPRYNSWVYGHRGTCYEPSIIPAYPHGFYQARMVCQLPFPGATSVHHEAPGGWWLDATPVPQPRHVMPVVVVQQVWERGPMMVADVRAFGLRMGSECAIPTHGYALSAVGATSGQCCQSTPAACCEKAGKLAGIWYREVDSMVFAATFHGDEMKLCMTQCEEGTTICFTLTADYAITKEGLVHGVVTGVDVDINRDSKRGSAGSAVGEMAAELQSLVDCPFSFRVKQTSSGIMVSSPKVAAEGTGKKELAMICGMYKLAADGKVPAAKPIKTTTNGLSRCDGPACRNVQVEVHTLPIADAVPVMPTPTFPGMVVPAPREMTLPTGRYLEHYPQYFSPDPQHPLPRELAAQEDLHGARRVGEFNTVVPTPSKPGCCDAPKPTTGPQPFSPLQPANVPAGDFGMMADVFGQMLGSPQSCQVQPAGMGSVASRPLPSPSVPGPITRSLTGSWVRQVGPYLYVVKLTPSEITITAKAATELENGKTAVDGMIVTAEYHLARDGVTAIGLVSCVHARLDGDFDGADMNSLQEELAKFQKAMTDKPFAMSLRVHGDSLWSATCACRMAVPARIGALHLGYVPLPRPGFLSPRVCFGNRHPIEQFPTTHVVVDDVPVRAPPDGELGRHQGRRQPPCIDEPAPAHIAGEARALRPEETAAHYRMNAIGADYYIGFDLFAILEAGTRARGVRRDRDAACTQVNVLISNGFAQYLLEIAPMHRAKAGAEMIAISIERGAVDGTTAAPASRNMGPGDKSLGENRLLDGEAAQRLHRVWCHHHTAAELADARRLLVDGSVDATQEQRAGGREAAEAGADDCDLWCARHPLSRRCGCNASGATFSCLASWLRWCFVVALLRRERIEPRQRGVGPRDLQLGAAHVPLDRYALQSGDQSVFAGCTPSQTCLQPGMRPVHHRVEVLSPQREALLIMRAMMQQMGADDLGCRFIQQDELHALRIALRRIVDRAFDPGLQLQVALLGEPVDPLVEAILLRHFAFDQPLRLEPPQLRIDLARQCVPPRAQRLVELMTQLVTAGWRSAQEAEDREAQRHSTPFPCSVLGCTTVQH